MNFRYGLSGFLLTGAAVLAVFAGQARVAQGIGSVTVSADSHVKGPANAPVQIVEYSDFQCPACRTAQAALQEIFAAYPGKVSLTFQHFPLSGHKWASAAHQSAECAGEQGKFWEYHDRLFAEQAQWSALPEPMVRFLEFAKDLNLNLDRFAACLTNEEVKARILEQKSQGVERQVRSTPTFFVNGRMLVGSTELRQQGLAIAEEVITGRKAPASGERKDG